MIEHPFAVAYVSELYVQKLKFEILILSCLYSQWSDTGNCRGNFFNLFYVDTFGTCFCTLNIKRGWAIAG